MRLIRVLTLMVVATLPFWCGTLSARAGTTITVSTTADAVADDGECSLREAIAAANTDSPSGSSAGECPAGSGSDVVSVPPGTYNLTT
jgi:CSLREA domain-containing protein